MCTMVAYTLHLAYVYHTLRDVLDNAHNSESESFVIGICSRSRSDD